MYAQKLVYELRNNGIAAEKDLMSRSLKAQMKYADKIGAQYTIVLGEDEIKNNKAVLKNMKTGEQLEIKLDTLVDEFKIGGKYMGEINLGLKRSQGVLSLELKMSVRK
jgi:histidyl-tRNA synthetase